MSWLDNWAKRIKLTIDQTNIDDDLINFPVLVTLMSGTNTAGVFDELSTVSGTKKIAITTTVSGVETELYTEIERWDWTNEKANLWVKIPTVSSGTNTELYLYYDSDHADNTTHVGDTGDSAAQNVWDSNFVGVWHMAQDPNGDVADAIKDSTSNTNHGTPAGSMTSADLVDGKVGKGIDFDGGDDYINILNHSSLRPNKLTIESTIKTTETSWQEMFESYYQNTTVAGFEFRQDVNNKLQLVNGKNTGTVLGIDYQQISSASPINTGSFIYTSGTYDGIKLRIFINGINDGEIDWTIDPVYDVANNRINIGVNNYVGNTFTSWFKNIIDEIRISNTARSAAWIKATYYSNWDELVAYGIEQIIHYYYDGYVTENNNPVSRKVSLYNRDTGVFADTTTSNDSTGYYYLTTTVSGEHFIVTFDDDAGEDYNALVLDKLLPRGIE